MDHHVTAACLIAGLLACGVSCGTGATAKAVRPDAPTAREALGLRACAPSDEPQLLTLDWEDTQRIELERAMSKHVAVVRYDCTGLKVLRDCEVDGGYEYAGVSPAKTSAKLSDADEVRTNLPLGGADISGALASGATLDLVYVTVGQQSTTVHDVERERLRGSCEGATHTVRAANLGAFALTSGTRGEVNAAMSLLGEGGSAASTSARSIRRVNGELEACNAAGESSKEPTPRCKAVVQLLLSQVAAGKSRETGDGRRASKRRDERHTLETVAIKNPCNGDLVLSKEGVCTRATKATAFMCDAADLDQCRAQCAKGDGRSCYNAAATMRGSADAIGFLERSCAAGYAAGCGDLGYLMLLGRGTRPDQERAEALLVKACAMGDAAACTFVARSSTSGAYGFTTDHAAARKGFERGCALGSHHACREAARMSVEGLGGPRDIAAATRLLERSCTGGNDDNCRLGRHIANSEASLAGEGERVSLHEDARNDHASVEPLKNPCKSTLRVDDRTLRCVDPNGPSAGGAGFVCDATNFDECANQCDRGNARSCWQAAANRQSNSNQNHASRGHEEALPWFEKGCKKGYAPACTAFASAVFYGRGTAVNPERGRTLMERACEMNDAPACMMVAGHLASGSAGFPSEPGRALVLYEKACTTGLTVACTAKKRMEAAPKAPRPRGAKRSGRGL